MPGGDDLRGERRVAPHLLADQEEGRVHARGGEQLEHRRRALRVGTVVEGQRVATPARRAVLDAERSTQRGQSGGEPREHVAGQRRGCQPARDRWAQAAMIVGGHGRSCAGNRGGGGRVDPLQPRDRASRRWTPRRRPKESTCGWRSSGGLLRRARWLLGTGLSILGWPLQVLALLLAPLVVVQPALAVGLVVLLFAAQRLLHEHAGRYEYLAMSAIVVGVIGSGLFAPPRSTAHGSENLTITLVLDRARVARACCPTCCAWSLAPPPR